MQTLILNTGEKYGVEVLADKGHALSVKVTKARKLLLGKVLLVAKTSIVSLV